MKNLRAVFLLTGSCGMSFVQAVESVQTSAEPGETKAVHALSAPEVRFIGRSYSESMHSGIVYDIPPTFAAPPDGAHVVTTKEKTPWSEWGTDWSGASYRLGNSPWGPDWSRSGAEYQVVASPTLSGWKAIWEEVFEPFDEGSGTATVTRRVWNINGQQSGIFALETSYPGFLGARGLVLVPPVSLAVDANRDGLIAFPEENDSDETSLTKPLRFWINDDIDRREVYDSPNEIFSNGEVEIEEDDINEGAKDCDDTIINSKRDLEDLARLHLYVGGLADAIKAGQLKLAFVWKNRTGNPSVRIFRAADTQNGSDSYIRDDAVAGTQMLLYQGHVPPDSVNEFGRSLGVVASGQELVLDPASRVYDAFSSTQPKVFLLFEGVSEGSGQLVLLIKDPQGQTIGEGPGVWLDLKNVKSMYERWTLGENDQAAPATAAVREGFNYAAPVRDEEKDYVLFVHGYNMPSWEKERFAETAFKRLWHLGYKGRFGVLKWPCANPGSVGDELVNGDFTFFDRSERRAWQAGAGFLDCAQKLNGSLGYAGRVRVLAHSQGNVVVSEGLRLSGTNSHVVHTFVASQAAIAAHCFDPSSQWDMPFESSYEDGTPNVYARYWVSDANPSQSTRFPKTWPTTNPSYLASSYIGGAAGTYVNFYNPDDFALATGSWQRNQKLKPDDTLVTYSDAEGFRSYVNSHTGPIYADLMFSAGRYEIFAFGAEARSFALGACATGGVFAQAKNLKSDLNFGTRHIYHSGQFRNNLPNRVLYWEALLTDFELRAPQ